jgi:hypothetical protein
MLSHRTTISQLTPYLKSKLGMSDEEIKLAMKKSAEAPVKPPFLWLESCRWPVDLTGKWRRLEQKPRPDKIDQAVLFLGLPEVAKQEMPAKLMYMKQKLQLTDPEIKAGKRYSFRILPLPSSLAARVSRCLTALARAGCPWCPCDSFRPHRGGCRPCRN